MRRPKVLLAIFSIILVFLWMLPDGTLAQDGNQAALVIRHGDQDVQTMCVDFSEPEISGLELLQRSGMDLTLDVQGLGAAVCSIQQTGCPANDCWCQCKGGGDCIYWSYWLKDGDQWQYSQGGASIYSVNDGDIQGWSWGPGAVSQAYSPPDLSFEDVCQESMVEVATATPSATALIFVPPDTPTTEMYQSQPTGTPTSMPLPTSTIPPTATNPIQVTTIPTNTPLPAATATIEIVVPDVTDSSNDEALLEIGPTDNIELAVVEQSANVEQEFQPTAPSLPLPTQSPLAENDEIVTKTPEAVASLVEPDQTLPSRQGERDNKKWFEASDDQPSILIVVGAESQIPDLRVLPLAPEEQNANPDEQDTSGSLFSYLIFAMIVLWLSGWLIILSTRKNIFTPSDVE
jgi:hypothetical protein